MGDRDLHWSLHDFPVCIKGRVVKRVHKPHHLADSRQDPLPDLPIAEVNCRDHSWIPRLRIVRGMLPNLPFLHDPPECSELLASNHLSHPGQPLLELNLFVGFFHHPTSLARSLPWTRRRQCAATGHQSSPYSKPEAYSGAGPSIFLLSLAAQKRKPPADPRSPGGRGLRERPYPIDRSHYSHGRKFRQTSLPVDSAFIRLHSVVPVNPLPHDGEQPIDSQERVRSTGGKRVRRRWRFKCAYLRNGPWSNKSMYLFRVGRFRTKKCEASSRRSSSVG